MSCSIPNQKASFGRKNREKEYGYEVKYCAYETEDVPLCHSSCVVTCDGATYHPS